MKEIFMLRARWRELETEPRTRLNGHEGGTPGSLTLTKTGNRPPTKCEDEWKAAVKALDLDETACPDDVADQLETIEEIRDVLGR